MWVGKNEIDSVYPLECIVFTTINAIPSSNSLECIFLWISSGVFYVINVIRNINCTMHGMNQTNIPQMFTLLWATARRVRIVCVDAATRTPTSHNNNNRTAREVSWIDFIDKSPPTIVCTFSTWICVPQRRLGNMFIFREFYFFVLSLPSSGFHINLLIYWC